MQQVQTQTEIVPAPTQLPSFVPDTQTLLLYEKAFRPKQTEVAAMISCILERKRWTVSKLSAICGISGESLRSAIANGRPLKPPEVRVVWFIFMLDTAPKLLLDPLHIATWGKLEYAVPQSRPNSEQQRAQVLEYAMIHQHDRMRMNVVELARHYGMKPAVVREIVAGYGYMDPRRLRASSIYRKQRIFDPLHVWMNVRWSYTDRDIAKAIKRPEILVARIRAHMLMCGWEHLRTHWTQCGKDVSLLDGLSTADAKRHARKLAYDKRKAARRARKNAHEKRKAAQQLLRGQNLFMTTELPSWLPDFGKSNLSSISFQQI